MNLAYGITRHNTIVELREKSRETIKNDYDEYDHISYEAVNDENMYDLVQAKLFDSEVADVGAFPDSSILFSTVEDAMEEATKRLRVELRQHERKALEAANRILTLKLKYTNEDLYEQ